MLSWADLNHESEADNRWPQQFFDIDPSAACDWLVGLAKPCVKRNAGKRQGPRLASLGCIISETDAVPRYRRVGALETAVCLKTLIFSLFVIINVDFCYFWWCLVLVDLTTHSYLCTNHPIILLC